MLTLVATLDTTLVTSRKNVEWSSERVMKNGEPVEYAYWNGYVFVCGQIRTAM